MRILRIEQLFDGMWQFFCQRFLIGLLCRVLAGFGGFQQSMIAATEVSLEVAPCALNRAANRAFFLHVVNSLLVQSLFELAAELRAFKRFGREVVPQSLVLQVLADL